MKRQKIVTLPLPWTDQTGERQMSVIRLTGTEIDPRMARRMMVRFYRKQLGVHIRKSLINIFWKRRFQTYAISEENINSSMNRMAHESYLEVTNPDSQSEATEAAEQ